jgi:hypothetical protein
VIDFLLKAFEDGSTLERSICFGDFDNGIEEGVANGLENDA